MMHSKSRPDYIKCIKHTHADLPNTSWCGEKLLVQRPQNLLRLMCDG